MHTAIQGLLAERGIESCKASNAYGGEYHSPCPWCGGDDRFIVNPDKENGKGQYWCRQCDKGGDNIKLVRELTGASYQEACQRLGVQGRHYHRPAPLPRLPQKQQENWTPQRYAAPATLWQEKATAFVEWAHEQLLKCKETLNWLESRGLNVATVRKYKLGWNPGETKKNGDVKDLYRPRKAWGLPEELKDDGKPRRLWLPRGLVIPYIADGQIHRLRIRRKADGGMKYYIIPGSTGKTMVLEPERKAFVVVESELDAMAVVQATGDIVGAVALGSVATKPDVYATEKLRLSLQVLNALDYEMEDRKKGNSLRNIEWWTKNFENCDRYPVPDGKDPGEAIQKGIDIRSWIEKGLPPVMTIKQPPSRPAVPSKSEAIRSQLAPELLELGKLLTQSGACIHNAADELGIIEPYDLWRQQHWKVFSRISDLVFRTGSVWDYLRNHPADIITGENFIYEG